MPAVKSRISRPVRSPLADLDHAAPEKTGRVAPVFMALTRVSLGWVFLWAFLDKTFGLGHETPSDGSWLNGASPTEGFLANAAVGPFADLYHDVAGAAWADWLFMAGLLGIGVALVLGVGMRAAAVAGTILLVLMWSAVLPPANNPFMDDHLVYAMVLVLLAALNAGRHFGLGRWWETTSLVRGRRYLV